MRVETTPQVQNLRKSVRITTQFTYTGGLVIMDAAHMPQGCGTWPAFWSNGPNWPSGGEIDIVEGAALFLSFCSSSRPRMHDTMALERLQIALCHLFTHHIAIFPRVSGLNFEGLLVRAWRVEAGRRSDS